MQRNYLNNSIFCFSSLSPHLM